ncbi:MAG: dihydropteroate synthase [Saprospiraceae bacterium]
MNKLILNGQGLILEVETFPVIMGVINLTEDSFYEDSRIQHENGLLTRVEKMLTDGAQVIDIGAMSSRPGAKVIDPQKEVKIVCSALKVIRKEFPQTFISIDTVHGLVAKASLNLGANMINDISAGRIDATILDIVEEFQIPYVLMHMKGIPENMHLNTKYDDIVCELLAFFSNKIRYLQNRNIHQIVLDPGFGFSKNISSNFTLLKELQSFTIFDLPLLIGISRKSFIYKSLDITAREALNGTSVLHAIALQHGARIIRTHDVKEALEAAILIEMLKKG